MKKITELKKGERFIFNHITFTVKQKFADWKKDDSPYLKTKCGQEFFNEDLEVIPST